MNSTNSIILKCLFGKPIIIGENAICAIYPPTLGDIASISQETFASYYSILTQGKPTDIKDEEAKELFKTITDYQYFIFIAQDKEILKLIKEAFYFFTKEEIFISSEPLGIFVGPLSEERKMTENDFYEMRQVILRSCYIDVGLDDIIIKETDSDRVKALKQKMLEGRKKVKQAKLKKQGESESDIDLSDLIASLAVGLGLRVTDLQDMTYYAFHDQLKRMGWREQFDINIRSALAGAKKKGKDTPYWIRSYSSTN